MNLRGFVRDGAAVVFVILFITVLKQILVDEIIQ